MKGETRPRKCDKQSNSYIADGMGKGKNKKYRIRNKK
jgi:hypothetical protein